MAIQQLASGNSNGIMNFLFQDDGSTDGMVLEGPGFAKTLHQLLGEYENDEVTIIDMPELPATEATTQMLAELAGKAPLSTALDVLTTDFALPAQSAALPVETTWEGNAEGQEVEQPFWGIAPFTDVMAALQQHTATPNVTTPPQSTGAIDTLAATTTTPAGNELAQSAGTVKTPAATTTMPAANALANAALITTTLTQGTATIETPAATTTLPAANEPANAAPNTTTLAQSTGTIETPVATTTTPAANEPANAAPLAPVFGNGIAQVIELARDLSQVAAQLTQQPALPAHMPGRNAPASGKTLPQSFRPAPNTLNFRSASNSLNQAVSALQARAAQTTAMTETQPFPMFDTTTFASDLAVAEPRSQQAATPASPTLLQGLHALRADNPLVSHAKPAALDTTATGPSLQLQSPHLAGTDAWLEDLGTRVDWLKDMKVQKADLQLHPAELGLLEIHIATGDDATTVSFVTHNAAARELIEENMPRLRDLLANQGMQLGQSHVSQHSAEGQRRDKDTHTGASTTQRDKATAEVAAPIRRTAYMADPSRIDHYV